MNTPNVFIAQPKDDTLEALLSEGFATMERHFASLDRDKAGIFTFKTLENHLSARHLVNIDKLHKVYESVDVEGSGTLYFAEYLALLYLWAATDENLNAFFKHSQNVAVVTKAFMMMESAWVKYDADKNRRLSLDEFTNLITSEMPNLLGNLQGRIDEFYPQADRSEGLKFVTYMHLLYCCLTDQTDNNIPGNYTKLQPAEFARVSSDTQSWGASADAFKALEADFDGYNTEEGYLDLIELKRSFPDRSNMENLTIHSRLEGYYQMVDPDQTRTLDFFEFMYLAFLMSQDGSYSHLVHGSKNSHLIKILFLRLLKAFRKADTAGDKFLTLDELFIFFEAAYGLVPPEASALFDQLSHDSASAPGTRVVDLKQLLKLVYHCLVADPQYPADHYPGPKPVRHHDADHHDFADLGSDAAHPPRIDPVENQNFSKSKILGEGGQGVVWLGTYNGTHQVAAKVMHGQVTPELLEDIRKEVELCFQMDHPNCHYMLGCKMQPDAQGGPLMLTEVCEKGSLFDLYTKGGYTFKAATAWRFAAECAAGMEVMHNIGYMHRDIKSLNVFLTSGFVSKIADFGMASKNPTESDFIGTAQWMAPEVVACMQAPRPYDKRCDIYSYGVLVWEIYHCQAPFSHVQLDQMSIARAALTQGFRPLMTGARPGRPPLPPGIAAFIQACWAADPSKRPQTFGQVLQMLEPLKPAD